MKNFTKYLTEEGTLIIYGDDGYYIIAEISECENNTEEELNVIADDTLTNLGYIKGSYFTAETDEIAQSNIKK